MTTEQIALFLDIVKTGSINKSAANFYITHQSASFSLKKLESELGYPLFERSPNGVVLTEYGRKASIILQNIFLQYKELKNIHLDDKSISLSIQIPSIYTLLSQTSSAEAHYDTINQIKLQSYVLDNEEIQKNALNPKTAQLYFYYTFSKTPLIAKDHPHIHCGCFAYDHLDAVINKAHPLSEHKFFPIKNTFKYSFAVYQPYIQKINLTHEYFGLKIDPSNISYTPYTLSSFINILKHSDAVALLPSIITKCLPADCLNILPCKPTLPIYWWYAYSKDNLPIIQETILQFIHNNSSF